MKKYQLITGNDSVKRDDGAYVPADTGNKDYRDYLVWLAEGNTPAPADPIPEPSYKEKRKADYAIEAPDADVMEALIEVIDAAGLIVLGSKLKILKDKRQTINNKYPEII